MKRIVTTLTSILFLTSFCFVWSADNLRNKPGVAEVADAETQFAYDLFQTVSAAQAGKNLFLSPFSISTALALTELGARGITAQQMVSALRLPSSQASVKVGYGNYLSVLQNQTASTQSGYLLEAAQRIYVSNRLTLQTNFIAEARQYFKADAQSANFAGDAENERKRINDWVAVQTHYKITNLLAPGTVSGYTALLLLQALYFKGSWLHKFEAAQTRDGVFHATQGNVTVKMMSQTRKFRYTRNDTLGFSAVELPYGVTNGSEDADVSMLIVLPNSKDGLTQLEAKLNPATLKNIKNSLYSRKVNIKLPRFSLESSLSLKAALITLGMSNAFSDSANFTGLVVEKTALKISDVVHKAVVQVNEEGAEAAAATGVVIVPLSFELPVDFFVDRAFHFYILDNRAGIILFEGRLITPQ